MGRKLLVRVIGLTLAFAFFGSSAFAQFRLRIEDTSLGIGAVITDNGPGDGNPVIGAVTFSGTIGNFVVNVTTGTSKPIIGGIGDIGQLDLNSVNVAAATGGTLRITLEDTGYTGPTGTFLQVKGDVGGTFSATTAGSSLLIQSWANGDNLVPALGPDQPIGAIGAIGGIPGGSAPAWPVPGHSVTTNGAFASSSSNSFNNGAVNTFSLFAQVVITFTGPGSTSFDESQTVLVPEPTSLLLLGTGLTGLGLLKRRKARKAQRKAQQ